jgi:hypothetical protein
VDWDQNAFGFNREITGGGGESWFQSGACIIFLDHVPGLQVDATFYNWKAKYTGTGVSEARAEVNLDHPEPMYCLRTRTARLLADANCPALTLLGEDPNPGATFHVLLCGSRGGYLPRYAPGMIDFRDPQIVCALQIQSGTRIATKIACEAHCRVGRDATPLEDHIINTRSRHVERLGPPTQSVA